MLAILGASGVELVEADSRKAAFLREAARITAAAVTIRGCRVEAVAPHEVDVVPARACGPPARLLAAGARFNGPRTTCLFLKGARVDEELTEAAKAWTMTVSHHPSRADPGGSVLLLQQVVRESR